MPRKPGNKARKINPCTDCPRKCSRPGVSICDECKKWRQIVAKVHQSGLPPQTDELEAARREQILRGRVHGLRALGYR